jgi:F-type H+-transporting ATPase subunit b
VIIPDGSFLVQWLNFLLLIFLLNRFLFRPILNRMDERNRTIQGNLDDAAADRAEAGKRMADYEEAIAAARHQGMEQVLEMEREISAEVRRIMDEKRAEAERMTEEARASIEGQSREAEKGLEGRVRDLAGVIGRRLAGREINV